MNTSIKARTPSLVTVSGRNKAKRELAFLSIAPQAYSSERGKRQLVETLGIALGDAPTDAQVACARQEIVIGYATVRMPASEFPKGTTEGGDQLEHVRMLVTRYAAPPKEGAKANKLRAGQLGRRTAIQHRVIRNAEEAATKVLAELKLNSAKTEREQHVAKAKRRNAPTMAGAKGKAETPSHASLVAAPKATTRQEACDYLMQQATSMQAFANKHAKLLPTSYGMAVIAFKQAMNKAANELALANTATDADK